MPKKWPRVDKKILPLVVVLNQAGIPTTGSCEGHIDQRSPAPWVKITPKSSSKEEGKRLRRRMQVLLKEFYKDRRTNADNRFVIEDGILGFWLHNGGKDYRAWRREVMARAERRKKKAPVMEKKLDNIEKKRRTMRLKQYQAEIKVFVKYLLALSS